ncbi:UNVERIFIED_CONTAM: hypothetical protein FKN15_058206 [Acipenser sinensis]
MKEEMDICASSASLLEEELASAIEPAVKAAVLSVMSALAKFVDSKCAVFNLRLDEREQEFESVRLRLEIAESELKAVSEREYTNPAENATQSVTNTNEQHIDLIHLPTRQKEGHPVKRVSFYTEAESVNHQLSDSIIAQGLPVTTRGYSTKPVQPTWDPVSAVHTALKNSRVLIQEDGSYSEQDLLMRGPAERNTLPHAEEGSKAESVPIQEELFDQEWCRSPEQTTELTSIEGEEETSALDPVHINEEIPGIEPVIIKEEVLELESDPIEEGGSDHFERLQQIHMGQKLHLCTVCGKSHYTSKFTQGKICTTALSVKRVSNSYHTLKHTSKFTQEKNLTIVLTVERVSFCQRTLKDTSKFTAERSHIAVITVGRVSPAQEH